MNYTHLHVTCHVEPFNKPIICDIEIDKDYDYHKSCNNFS